MDKEEYVAKKLSKGCLKTVGCELNPETCGCLKDDATCADAPPLTCNRLLALAWKGRE